MSELSGCLTWKAVIITALDSLPLLLLPPAPCDALAAIQVGHWLGLLHVFENGCSSTGDSVDDTAPQATAAYGCPLQRKTCPGPLKDPVTNYMGYTDDACMNGFTRGQADRILSMWGVYRGSADGAFSSSSGTKPGDIIYEAAPRPPPAVAPAAPANPGSGDGSGVGMQLPVLLRVLTNRALIGGGSSSSTGNKGSTTPVLAAAQDDGEAAGQYATTFESYKAPAVADPAAMFAAQQAAAGVTLQQQQYLQPMVVSAALVDPTAVTGSTAAYHTPTVAAAFAAHQQQANAAAQQQQQQQLWQQQLQQQQQQQQQQQYSYGTWSTTPQPVAAQAPAAKPMSAGQSILSKVAKNTAANTYHASSSNPPVPAAVAAAAATPAALEASQIWSSSAAGSIFNNQDDGSYNAPGSSSFTSSGSFSGSSGGLFNVPRIPIPAAPAAQYIQAKPILGGGIRATYNLASLLTTMGGSYGAGSPPARMPNDFVGVAAAAVAPDAMPAIGIVPKPRAAPNRLSSGRRRML
jgi:hypothetical protein